MTYPQVVSREEWRAARTELLAREKELTRARDALNAERRRLPMVEVTEDYAFEGPGGEVRLLDLFAGRRQLILGHIMFDPEWDEACPSCSAGADEMSEGLLRHLNERDTTYVAVSRAPYAKIRAVHERKGWPFAWYSSHGSRFNHDYHVTMDSSVAPPEYNFRTPDEHRAAGTGYYFDGDEPMEQPGTSCFLRDGDTVHHTYSMYGRGAETVGGSYYFLDLTALGRQEEWEEPKGRAAATRPANAQAE